YNPVHVEAGASGNFYGLDDGRKQIVRLGPTGKRGATYRLPDGPPKAKRKPIWRDFRVCEKTKAFYLLPHPDPTARIVCVGFDGRERWAYDKRVPVHFTADGMRVVAPFDVDEAGVLYVLDGETVKKISPEGKPAGTIKLSDAKSGVVYLRVHGDL